MATGLHVPVHTVADFKAMNLLCEALPRAVANLKENAPANLHTPSPVTMRTTAKKRSGPTQEQRDKAKTKLTKGKLALSFVEQLVKERMFTDDPEKCASDFKCVHALWKSSDTVKKKAELDEQEERLDIQSAENSAKKEELEKREKHLEVLEGLEETRRHYMERSTKNLGESEALYREEYAKYTKYNMASDELWQERQEEYRKVTDEHDKRFGELDKKEDELSDREVAVADREAALASAPELEERIKWLKKLSADDEETYCLLRKHYTNELEENTNELDELEAQVEQRKRELSELEKQAKPKRRKHAHVL